MVACYLAECGCQLMSPTALEIWDERHLLAVWSVGGNVRTCSEFRVILLFFFVFFCCRCCFHTRDAYERRTAS